MISAKFSEKIVLEIAQKVHPGAVLSSWNVDTCGTRGTSYQSELFRLRLEATAEGEPFIVDAFVKALPRNLARRLTFRSNEFYSREIEFLDKIWPAFVELQRRHNVPEPYEGVPRYN